MDSPKGPRLDRLLTAYGVAKTKSFYERVRAYRHQASPKDELHDLVERMTPEQTATALSVVQGVMAPMLPVAFRKSGTEQE